MRKAIALTVAFAALVAFAMPAAAGCFGSHSATASTKQSTTATQTAENPQTPRPDRDAE